MFECCTRCERSAPVEEFQTFEPDAEKPVRTEEVTVLESNPQPEPEAPPEPKSVRGVVLFETEEGKEVEVQFTKGPIGIIFGSKRPIKVQTVKGHAEELGIKPGWTFKAVQGTPVADTDFPTLKADLLELSNTLQGA
mmetsp:Transcript_15448/g.28971  ORF Transcript_15448/g.28971 Transcript_15448/m.28971 type:complete len:137 (+) Transcript_15448:73-483(+)